MNHFLSLAVAAIFLSLALAQEDDYHENERNKDVGDGYYPNRPYYGGSRYGNRHGGRYGGSYGGRYGGYGGYGYAYKKCPKLEDPANGRVRIQGTRPGSRAIYFCDIGHNLNGKRVRVCQRDGTWSDEAPVCDPVDCGAPDPADPNGSVSVGATTFNNTATYSCNEGFLLDVTEGGKETVICQANGEWSHTAPVCTPIDCGLPAPADDNGDVSFTTTILNSQAVYTCNEGYMLAGGASQVVSTCQANGDWSVSSAPDCLPVDCGNPPSADSNGGVAFVTTTYRSFATYSCNNGFVLDTSNGGSQVINCQADETWSGTAPACVRIDCGILLSPENGVVDYAPDSQLGSDAEYSCIRGFRLDGTDTRQCQASGQWSLTAPTCIRITCPKLTAPDNGKVTSSGNFVDDYAVYRCAYGFTLNGDRKRVCQEDGTWSGTDPTCEKDKKYGDYGYHGGYGGPRHGGRRNDYGG